MSWTDMQWPPVEILALALLVLVILSLSAFVLHLRYWDRTLGVNLPYALEERIETPDGTTIELRRIPMVGAPAAGLPPIMLVHGLGANHRNIDCTPDYSLARYLSAEGRDVWLVTLRSGLRTVSRKLAKRIRFAAMVEEDLPVAIDTVLARTAAAQLDFVGFSMGGMLLYAAIEESVSQQKIRRAVFIGSPAIIRPPFPVPRWLLRRASRFAFRLPLRLFARAGAFASEWVKTPLHHIVMNPENVAPGMARLALANLVADVPAALNLDFALWAMTDTGSMTLGEENVVDRLARVGVPALFIAGKADRIAPPAAVRVAFDAWGAETPETEKEFVLLGEDSGAHADYGHGDLAIGRYARDDVFAPTAAFLTVGGAPFGNGPSLDASLVARVH